MLQRRVLIGFLALIAGLAGVGNNQARAELVSLESLIQPGATKTVGNLLFFNFSYSRTGEMPLAGGVNVVDIVDVFGNAGLRFTGGFTDALGGFASDAVIGYSVRTLSGQPLIISNLLLGNPAVLGGNGAVGVTETVQGVSPNANSPLGQKEIFDVVDANGRRTLLQDQFTFAPVTELRIVKDIFAFNQGGVPTLSFVDQTFTAIPEPGSMALLGMGGLGMLVLARRRMAA